MEYKLKKWNEKYKMLKSITINDISEVENNISFYDNAYLNGMSVGKKFVSAEKKKKKFFIYCHNLQYDLAKEMSVKIQSIHLELIEHRQTQIENNVVCTIRFVDDDDDESFEKNQGAYLKMCDDLKNQHKLRMKCLECVKITIKHKPN